MCELLGLAFNTPVSPGLSFRGFRHRGRRNPDGWGLAAISGHETTIHKEPIDAEDSDAATWLGGGRAAPGPDRAAAVHTLFQREPSPLADDR